MDRPLRIGTRASALARWQANWVAEQLARHTGQRPEMVLITTQGDERQSAPLAATTQPGLFTKEIQRALLADEIDIAVHSLKDLPTDRVAGLVLAAVPERESPVDVLVSRENLTLAQLPAGAIVGTGSLRRRANLLHARHDLVMSDIRGNVDTRLAKLDAGPFAAIVLAAAGLRRLNLADRITEELSAEIMLPAIGQGALGIETREDDIATRSALAPLDHAATHTAVIAERTLLETVGGGCLAPIGAWAHVASPNRLSLQASVCSADGREKLVAVAEGVFNDPQQLGGRVAEQLLAQGAAALIRDCRRNGAQ